MVVDEAGRVTLVRPALGLIALTVIHQGDWLKCVPACLGEAIEKIREITVANSDELIRIRINRVDEGIGWQESVFDEFQDAAEITGVRREP